MNQFNESVWNGEKDRQLAAYRPCPCGVCSRGHKGVGYLSSSDANGCGFTIWIEDEKVFRRLRHALRRVRYVQVNRTEANEAPRRTVRPKPNRKELLKRARRATIEDQLYLMDWLEMKYSKVRPKK